MYFNSFGTEYILQEVLTKIKDKSITHNVFRIQNDDSFMSEFHCIAFIEDMIARSVYKTKDYKTTVKSIIKIKYNYFKDIYGKTKRKPCL